MDVPKHYRIEGDPKHIFVAVPGERGRYVRTNTAVLTAGCPFCGAEAGWPCVNRKGRAYSYPHAGRRQNAKVEACPDCGKPFERRNGRVRCWSCQRKRDRVSAQRCAKNYAAKHPERMAAARAVKAALKRGDLVRPDYCENCGRQAGRPYPIHAHHDSYEPEHHLDVQWLCQMCHTDIHEEDRIARRKAS